MTLAENLFELVKKLGNHELRNLGGITLLTIGAVAFPFCFGPPCLTTTQFSDLLNDSLFAEAREFLVILAVILMWRKESQELQVDSDDDESLLNEIMDVVENIASALVDQAKELEDADDDSSIWTKCFLFEPDIGFALAPSMAFGNAIFAMLFSTFTFSCGIVWDRHTAKFGTFFKAVTLQLLVTFLFALSMAVEFVGVGGEVEQLVELLDRDAVDRMAQKLSPLRNQDDQAQTMTQILMTSNRNTNEIGQLRLLFDHLQKEITRLKKLKDEEESVEEASESSASTLMDALGL